MENSKNIYKGISLRLWYELAVLILIEGVAIGVYSYFAGKDSGIALTLFLVYQVGVIIYFLRWLFVVRKSRRLNAGRTVNVVSNEPVKVQYASAAQQSATIDDHLYWIANPHGIFRGTLCPVCNGNIGQEVANQTTKAIGVSRCCSHVIHEDCARRFFDQAGTLLCPSCRCKEFNRTFPVFVPPKKDDPRHKTESFTILEPEFWAYVMERSLANPNCSICSGLLNRATMETVVPMCCFRTMHQDCATRMANISGSTDCPACSSASFNSGSEINVRIPPRRP